MTNAHDRAVIASAHALQKRFDAIKADRVAEKARADQAEAERDALAEKVAGLEVVLATVGAELKAEKARADQAEAERDALRERLEQLESDLRLAYEQQAPLTGEATDG